MKCVSWDDFPGYCSWIRRWRSRHRLLTTTSSRTIGRCIHIPPTQAWLRSRAYPLPPFGTDCRPRSSISSGSFPLPTSVPRSSLLEARTVCEEGHLESSLSGWEQSVLRHNSSLVHLALDNLCQSCSSWRMLTFACSWAGPATQRHQRLQLRQRTPLAT